MRSGQTLPQMIYSKHAMFRGFCIWESWGRCLGPALHPPSLLGSPEPRLGPDRNLLFFTFCFNRWRVGNSMWEKEGFPGPKAWRQQQVYFRVVSAHKRLTKLFLKIISWKRSMLQEICQSKNYSVSLLGPPSIHWSSFQAMGYADGDSRSFCGSSYIHRSWA